MNARPVAVLVSVVLLVALGTHPSGVLVMIVVATGLAAAVAYPFRARTLAPRADRRSAAPGAAVPDRRLVAEQGRHDVETETGSAPRAGDDDLTAWSDDTLYRAWRASYIRLRRLQRLQQYGGRGLTQIAQVALERRRYLDELERRHPAGFSAWLARRAHGPGDSGPYLMPGIPERGRRSALPRWTDLK